MAAEQHDLGSLTSFGPSFPTPDTPEGGDYAIRDAKGQIVAETFARSDYTVTQPAEKVESAWDEPQAEREPGQEG